MTIREQLDAALTDVPDDELIFVVRGSHPAAPETLREYARRVLRYHQLRSFPATADGRDAFAQAQTAARREADHAFAMADQMEAHATHQSRMADEQRAGLTANDENARLEAARDARKNG